MQPSVNLLNDLKSLVPFLDRQQSFVDKELEKLKFWVNMCDNPNLKSSIEEHLDETNLKKIGGKEALSKFVPGNSQLNQNPKGVCYVRVKCGDIILNTASPLIAKRTPDIKVSHQRSKRQTKAKDVVSTFTLGYLKNQTVNSHSLEDITLSKIDVIPNDLTEENLWSHHDKLEEATNLSNLPYYGKEVSTRKSHRFHSLLENPISKRARILPGNHLNTAGLFDKLASLLVHDADTPIRTRHISENDSYRTRNTINVSCLNLDEKAYLRLRAAKLLPLESMLNNDLTIHSELDNVIDMKISSLNDLIVKMNKDLNELYPETSKFVCESNKRYVPFIVMLCKCHLLKIFHLIVKK